MSIFNLIAVSSITNITRRAIAPITKFHKCFHILQKSASGVVDLNLPHIPQTLDTTSTMKKLLATHIPIYSAVCGFKVKGRLKRRCKDCYFVMRQERLYVICKTHPRHKQMSMKAKDEKSWILTHATQSPIRPW